MAAQIGEVICSHLWSLQEEFTFRFVLSHSPYIFSDQLLQMFETKSHSCCQFCSGAME